MCLCQCLCGKQLVLAPFWGNAPGKENAENKGRLWLLSLFLQHEGNAGSRSKTDLSLVSQPQWRGFKQM